MRREHMKSDWDHVHENLSMKWGKLYDIELCSTCDQKEELIQELQEQYHLSREDAEHEVATFYNSWINRTFM